MPEGSSAKRHRRRDLRHQRGARGAPLGRGPSWSRSVVLPNIVSNSARGDACVAWKDYAMRLVKESIPPLLQERQVTCAQLSASLSTIIRLEREGLLDKIRPSGKPKGNVYHRCRQVAALASIDNDSAA